MATFPALQPAARSYTLGTYSVTEERGFGGGSIRFIHGYSNHSFELSLSFVSLTQAEAALIRNHYRGQQGGFIAFPLSTEAWDGHTTFYDVMPSSLEWRYASPPSETHTRNGRVDVEVSLSTVPVVIYGNAQGMNRSLTVSIVGGSATGG